MLSFNRRFVLLGLPAGFAACGFEPAYGPGGQASKLQNAVVVDAPSSRPDYLLTREIEERLGRGDRQLYGLSYGVTIEEQEIAITVNNISTRFNLVGTVKYALRDLDTKQVLLSGQVNSFTSYSATGSTVATQAAARDAEERLMGILADQVLNRLTAEAGTIPA